MSQKEVTRSYKAQLGAATRAMHQIWKPIGGPELPEDAYARYAGRVVSLLTNGADDIEIADYLGEVEQSDMGLGSVGRRDLLDVARKIRAAVAASSDRAT